MIGNAYWRLPLSEWHPQERMVHYLQGLAMRLYGTRINFYLRNSCQLLVILLCLKPCLGLTASIDDQRLQQALRLVRESDIDSAITAIGSLDASAPITPALGRLAFLRATLAQQRRDVDSAQRFFTLVWLVYPPLADYAALELAQMAAEQDDLQALQAFDAAIAARYAPSLMRPQVQLILGQTQYRLGQKVIARQTIDRFLAAYPSHSAAPSAYLLRAQLAEDAGDLRQTAMILRHLGETYPHHALAALALSRSRQLFAQLPSQQRPTPDPAHLLSTLKPLIAAGHWAEVEARLQTLDQLPQTRDLAEHQLLAQAILAQHRKRWRRAITLFERWLLRYPKSPQRAEVHYRLGRLYFTQGQEESTERHYHHASAQRDDLIWAPRALMGLARLREQHDDLEAASALYQRLGIAFPNHDDAVMSLWRAAWLQYRLGRYHEAAKRWRRLLKQFPDSRREPQTLYWLARATQQMGHETRAERLYQQIIAAYPLHYYSLLSRDRLPQALTQIATEKPADEDRAAEVLTWLRRDPVILPEPFSSRVTPAQYHLMRANEFQHLQMSDRADAEIRALGRVLPEDHATRYFLAKILVRNENYLAAFQHLNHILGTLTPEQVRQLPQAFWSMLYPQAFWDAVTEHAKLHNLSPYLLLSLIRQESAFNLRAVSPAGARGLMQVMPATARRVSRQLNMSRFKSSQLFELKPNMRLGTHYFATQLRQFNGDLALALAAYNAGPNRVVRWQQQWPGLPMDEFVEHIPFQETRWYIKLILRNLVIYEYLYKPVPDA